MLLGAELRSFDAQPVRHAPCVGAAGQEDEALRVALGRVGRDRERDAEGRPCSCNRSREREAHTVRRRLRVDRGCPRSSPAAGVGERELPGARTAAQDQAEREPARVGEDERVVGPNQVDAAAALPERRELRRRPSRMHRSPGRLERGLHLRGRPRRVALLQEGSGGGNVWRRHARSAPVVIRPLVVRERREEIHTRRCDVRLHLQRDRGRPARREAGDHVRRAAVTFGGRGDRDRLRSCSG